MNYNILLGESPGDYKKRIYLQKQNDKSISWRYLTQIINICLNQKKDESTYRKESYKIIDSILSERETPSEVTEDPNKKWKEKSDEIYYNNLDSEDAKYYEESTEDRLNKLFLEMKKEKVKISDERAQNNAYIRALAREETLKEIAIEVSKSISSHKILPEYDDIKIINNTNEAILVISDWHYGIQFMNYLNKYDPDTCIKRLADLKNQIRSWQKLYGFTKLHIVNLGDLIAGNIHLQIRIESRFDVITQTIKISEILSEFINDLTKIVYIEYYDCLDNHSRVTPNKKESIDLESFARITPWFMKERLNKLITTGKLHMNDNAFGEDIVDFKIFDFKIAGVHGDKDKPSKAINNISMLTEQHYDLILTSHFHHFSGNEQNRTILLSNSSLMGTDVFAKNMRLSAMPSQNLIIVTKDNITKGIHRLQVS